jgi:acyl-CoA reductase-like NAD-dependent aldehyde dehydrogenase
MKIGDPLNSSTTVGATISKEHAEKVLGYIKGAVKEGATVATGGQRVDVEGYMEDSIDNHFCSM